MAEFPSPGLVTEPALPGKGGDASSAGGVAGPDSGKRGASRERVRRDRTRGGGATPYAELHSHSAFSFGDGASTPLELAATAAELGYPAMALTDHDGLWGSLEFAQACRELGVRAITGAEVTVAPGQHLTLLVETARGYANLCRLLTAAHAQTRDGPQRTAEQPRVELERVEALSEGLVCLSGCAGEGLLSSRWRRGDAVGAEGLGRRLVAAFGRDRFRVELQRPFWRRDRARNRWLADLARRLGVACVASGDVHAHDRRRAWLQDALVAVRLGKTLDASEPERRGNAASVLAPPAAMAERFAEHPEAVAETLRLADRLRFDLCEELGYRYPGSEDPDADRKLAGLCEELLGGRYAGSPDRPAAERRLREELAVIRKLGLSGFFLLHRDLLELAREVAVEVRGENSARQALPPGRGRGSSVSSIVCYLTGLSHVDPVKADLFAGRFLNEEVRSMPDIDLDFPRDVREKLIPRVHERYGTDRSALVAAFPTYRSRGAVRDLGKALGLPPGEIERVARMVDFYGGAEEIRRDVAGAIGARRAESLRWRRLVELSGEVLGLPRHPSQHPGGMVISTRPLVEICPVVPAAMEGRQIVQWDKDSCADAGFLKIDLLGLGMLSAVERCVEEIGRVRGERLDLSRIPLDDDATYASIQAADTTGVFQIESRAQMQMLPRTLPENLDDLTVQVALVRPGPIQGGAVHPYIERRRRLREDPGYEVPYDHPSLEPVLRDTLGAIVFQEQVIEVAMALAGFSSGEAEGLRRAMSRKRSEAALRAYRDRFVEGAVSHGVSVEVAERVFGQILGFSGFGFPKAHSAAFGLLAYQSAWLRVHYGPEFLCSLLNEQPMGFYPPDALVHEAQRRRIEVLGPDVNRSAVECRVEAGSLAVRVGLGYVKGVKEEEMKALAVERDRGGPFTGIADLASRSGAGRDGLERLAWSGALDELASSTRRPALWRLGTAAGGRRGAAGTQLSLPLEPPRAPELPELGRWETVLADYASTGMTLGDHPLALLRGELGDRVLRAADLERAADGGAVEVAGLVVARQRPATARGVVFMLLEDESGTINLVVPPPVFERFRGVVRAAPLVQARGTLERRQGATNVVVSFVAALERPDLPLAEVRHIEPPLDRETGRFGSESGAAAETNDEDQVASRRALREAREWAVAELRAVAPVAHSFGRRGR
jgi:error-prone DNA polymerase